MNLTLTDTEAVLIARALAIYSRVQHDDAAEEAQYADADKDAIHETLMAAQHADELSKRVILLRRSATA